MDENLGYIRPPSIWTNGRMDGPSHGEHSFGEHASLPKFDLQAAFLMLNKMAIEVFENSKVLQLLGIMFESHHTSLKMMFSKMNGRIFLSTKM